MEAKNREWVKTAIIIFLLIMLVLTFFSNTINNRFLPEVSTAAVVSGPITPKIRASGKVEALGNNQVKAAGTRTIAAVKVKAGQQINAGDILFVMGSAASEELEAAIDARDSAYFGVKRANTGWPSNYSSSLALDRAFNAWQEADLMASAALDAWQNAEYSPELAAAKAELDASAIALQGAQISGDNYRKMCKDMYDALAASYPGPDIPPDIQLQLEHYIIEASSISDDETYAQYDYDQKLARYNAVAAAQNTSALKLAYDSAVSKAQSAYSAYIAAVDSYNISAESNGRQAANTAIDIEEAELTLEKRQNKVNYLSGENEDANVYANVSGIVQSVNFAPGDTVAKGDILAVIEVPDIGYSLSATVTKDQAARIKIGDEGTANNAAWGSKIEATVSSIKIDQKDPQSKRIVTFDVSGDVTSGQELTLSVGQRSANYDVIVPKSAVRNDNNGSFVLTVVSKNNALGNRYFAQRINVDILAEDDSFKAINGDIGNGDFVIINSSAKINPGDQIRLSGK